MIVACMPVRNEDWCLGLSARAVLKWADQLVILDHASTDDTQDIAQSILSEYGEDRVGLIRMTDPVWYEMAHRQAMLDKARERGATHIAIVDADEVLTGNLLGVIRPLILKLKEGGLLQLPWTCLARSIHRYYTEGIWGTANVTMAFHDIPSYGWAQREGYDFHHREPLGSTTRGAARPVPLGAGGLMHLQFVSERRLRAKQSLYKLTELIRWPSRKPVHEIDAMYNRAVYESDPKVSATTGCPEEWWAPYDDLMQYLIIGGEPWQERAVREIIREHGRERFKGLDLFGVDQ